MEFTFTIHSQNDQFHEKQKSEVFTTKIPRPNNSFMTYRKEKQQEILDTFPGINNKEVSKIIGMRWRREPEEVKKIYRAKAAEEKSLHAKRYPGYKYSPRKRSQKDKKSPFISSTLAKGSDFYLEQSAVENFVNVCFVPKKRQCRRGEKSEATLNYLSPELEEMEDTTASWLSGSSQEIEGNLNDELPTIMTATPPTPPPSISVYSEALYNSTYHEYEYAPESYPTICGDSTDHFWSNHQLVERDLYYYGSPMVNEDKYTHSFPPSENYNRYEPVSPSLNYTRYEPESSYPLEFDVLYPGDLANSSINHIHYEPYFPYSADFPETIPQDKEGYASIGSPSPKSLEEFQNCLASLQVTLESLINDPQESSGCFLPEF
ncbi:slightly ste11-like protein [Basidiobolus ranarum]|uniref:Slightly ste11-like protein n=1 Tax=Basidiobolus ranarum TaxID=34480 RepID=A0ABR2WVC8_9FUNG